jgi:septal ring factor EnvC (AmiA/AmiB activator)
LEVSRLKQEEAIARQEALTARLERQRADADACWQEVRVAIREAGERQEKMMRDYARQTDRIVAELEGSRDERRAMLEALFN